MNYDNIVLYAFTHPDCKGKSIREVSRLLGMNPGTVYRILVRLGLIKPTARRGFNPPDPPRHQPDRLSLLSQVREYLSYELPIDELD
jgi:hypothetical protein